MKTDLPGGKLVGDQVMTCMLDSFERNPATGNPILASETSEKPWMFSRSWASDLEIENEVPLFGFLDEFDMGPKSMNRKKMPGPWIFDPGRLWHCNETRGNVESVTPPKMSCSCGNAK